MSWSMCCALGDELVLNRQSSSEWACIGLMFRPLVYKVGLQVD